MATPRHFPQNVVQERLSTDGIIVTEDIRPLTKIQFKGINMHYKDLLDEMQSDGSLVALRTELATLLQKFQVSYFVQCKLLRKLRERDSTAIMSTDEITSLKRSLKEKEESIKKLKADVKHFAQILEDGVIQRDQLISQLEVFKTKQEDFSQEHELILELRSKAQSTELQYSRTVEKMSAEILQNNGQISKLTEELLTTSEKAKIFEEEMLGAKSNFDKESKKVIKANKEIMDLRLQIESKDHRIQGFLEALKESRSKVNRLEFVMKDFHTIQQSLESQVQDLAIRLEASRRDSTSQADKLYASTLEKNEIFRELKPAKEKVRTLTEEVSILTKERYANMKRISTLDTTLTQFQEKLKHQSIEATTLTKELESMKERYSELVKESQNFRKQRELVLSKNIALATQISQLENSIRIKDEARMALHGEMQSMRVKCERDKTTIKRFEFEKNVFIRKIHDHVNVIKEHRQRIGTHEETIHNFEKELMNLKDELKSEINRSKAMIDLKIKFTSLYESTAIHLEREKRDNSHLNIYIERMKQIVGDYERTIANVKANRKKVDTINTSLTHTIRNMEEEIQVLKSEIRQKDQTIYEVRKENTEKNMILDRIHKEVEILQRRENNLVNQINLKRNVELLLNEKLFLMKRALEKGRRMYVQVVQDIKLVETALAEKQRQIVCLQKNIGHCTELQKQVVHAEKNLVEERLRARGLEIHMQQQVNIHDWRIIKTTEPDRYQLIVKNRALLKTVLRKTELLESKESQLREKDQIISTLSHPRILTAEKAGRQLVLFRSRCYQQRCKIESLSSQVNMYDTCFQQFTVEINHLKEELKSYKEKEYFQSLKKRKGL